jgi:hypothetical protein
MGKRRNTLNETAGLVLWESTAGTIVPERPAHSDPDSDGCPWHFQVSCACGWSTELRRTDSLGIFALHLSRCEAVATDWRPIGA